jgi:probable O-glycosylation ligase (exosortase A-associated)
MSQVTLYIAFALLAAASFFRPWVGLAAAYFVAILNPQAIWFWMFNDIRPVFVIIIPTLLGVVWRLLASKESLMGLRTGTTLWVCFLGIATVVSWLYAPFSISLGSSSIVDSTYVMEGQLKIIATFLVALIVITEPRRIAALSLAIIVSALYLIFWANSQYLTGPAVIRLSGPASPDGHGTYADENMFAAFFVASMPFLWYQGLIAKRIYLRAMLWISIPFLWHSVFLTGSRGGLLGLAAGMIFILLRSKKPISYSIVMIPVFLVALFWQGGESMLNRASSITEYKTDTSAFARIESWIVAGEMMVAYPFTGVGPGSFTRAFSEFNPGRPLQAHNAILQIAAEYGVAGLIAIVGLIFSCFLKCLKSAKLLSEQYKLGLSRELYVYNESVLAGLCGLVVCSIFLTFQLFEIFYMLLAMAACINNYLVRPDRLRFQSRTG